AIPRHCASLLEHDWHVVLEAADRQHLRLLGSRAAAAGPAEFEVQDLGDVEPTFLALSAFATAALARGRRLFVELGLRHDGADHVLDGQLAAANAGVDL